MKNDLIKREQSDACIDFAERENYRTKCKIMIIDCGPRKNMNTAAMIEAFAKGAKSVSDEIEVKTATSLPPIRQRRNRHGRMPIGRRICRMPSRLVNGW